MRTNGLRYLSAALATLWLSTMVAGGLHGIFSSHVHHYCDAHAVFEEGPGLEVSDSTSRPDSSGAALRGHFFQDSESHATCPWANLGHLAQKIRLGASTSVADSELISESGSLAPAPIALASAVPLSVAPKTSPPLV
jgi:hypothetical protein